MRSLALVVTIALLPSIAAAGQTPPRPEKEKATGSVSPAFAQMRVAEWTTAVRTHAAGTADAPLKTVAGWKREHVTLVVRLVIEQIHRLLEVRDEGRDFVYTKEVTELIGTLARGLSLHTDIAIFERNAEVPAGMPALRATGGAVILVDGQQTRFLQRSAHWPIARRDRRGAVDAPRREAAGDRVVSRHRRPDAAVGRLRSAGAAPRDRPGPVRR